MKEKRFEEVIKKYNWPLEEYKRKIKLYWIEKAVEIFIYCYGWEENAINIKNYILKW